MRRRDVDGWTVPSGFRLDRDSDPTITVFHRDGVWWSDALRPRRWHRCQIQTWAYDRYGVGTVVNRCACGGVRRPAITNTWFDRNSRRRRRRR